MKGNFGIKPVFLILLAVILIVLPGAYSSAQEMKEKNRELSGTVEDGVRVINVKASRYKFEPDPIVVKSGEKVRIIATSADVTHVLAIREFKVNLVIDPGRKAIAEFTADKEGQFTEHCSVYCGPGHENMEGKFIVATK